MLLPELSHTSPPGRTGSTLHPPTLLHTHTHQPPASVCWMMAWCVCCCFCSYDRLPNKHLLKDNVSLLAQFWIIVYGLITWCLQSGIRVLIRLPPLPFNQYLSPWENIMYIQGRASQSTLSKQVLTDMFRVMLPRITQPVKSNCNACLSQKCSLLQVTAPTWPLVTAWPTDINVFSGGSPDHGRAATGSYVGVCGLCCGQGPWWCPWSMLWLVARSLLSPEMVHAAAGGHVEVCGSC